MPNLGADMEAGTLRKWNVKPGDFVKRGDIIAEVETQKGLIEIEVFNNGKIEQLVIKENDKVPVGSLMALISGSEEVKEIKNEISQIPITKRIEEKPNEKINTPKINIPTKASPLAKKIAAENGINLEGLIGTGDEGAITKQDVEKVISLRNDTTVEKVSSSGNSIRSAIAAAMSKSNREIPHYYLETSIDMSRSMLWIKEENKKRIVQKRLLPVVLLVKALAKSLIDVPELNAYWENELKLKNDINIGFVVSLRGGGIMVPSILNADKRSVDEIMETLNDIIPRARALKLRSSELSNSTITLTNIGDGGVDKVFGVIYPPQVAIIGFGSITEQPFAENGKLDVRPQITVTLAADHRATDGHIGSRFLLSLKNHLQKPEML